jgi:hypothetical protein
LVTGAISGRVWPGGTLAGIYQAAGFWLTKILQEYIEWWPERLHARGGFVWLLLILPISQTYMGVSM